MQLASGLKLLQKENSHERVMVMSVDSGREESATESEGPEDLQDPFGAPSDDSAEIVFSRIHEKMRMLNWQGDVENRELTINDCLT